ncbi:MAG: hypothetical protein AMXMBFR7_49750 [Planctomycetota bacterium]
MPKAVTELVEAARAGDAAHARKILKAHPEAARDWKPIMNACFYGQPELVQMLLKAGADPNILSKTPHRHRPLHRTIEHKKTLPKTKAHDRVVEVLLAAGADPLQRGTYHRWTALALAACGGEPRFVAPLRKALPSLDLWHAAALGEAARVKALVKKDPKRATERDADGWTPLLWACASRMHATDSKAAHGLLEIAAFLLERGAKPNDAFLFEGKWPLPALYWASGWSGNAKLTELLLQAGADPHDGESLHHSAEQMHTDCLNALLAHGCDVNHRHYTAGNTALHFLISYTSLQGVTWLLEHGADPNVRCGKDGETALHAAARRGCNEKLLAKLLAHGANPAAKSKQGRTPLQLAQTAGHRNAAAFLKAHA